MENDHADDEVEYEGTVLTPEVLQEALLRDPNVLSVEYQHNTFYINTVEGPIILTMAAAQMVFNITAQICRSLELAEKSALN